MHFLPDFFLDQKCSQWQLFSNSLQDTNLLHEHSVFLERLSGWR